MVPGSTDYTGTFMRVQSYHIKESTMFVLLQGRRLLNLPILRRDRHHCYYYFPQQQLQQQLQRLHFTTTYRKDDCIEPLISGVFSRQGACRVRYRLLKYSALLSCSYCQSTHSLHSAPSHSTGLRERLLVYSLRRERYFASTVFTIHSLGYMVWRRWSSLALRSIS
jgi:hypothetical protein